MNLYPHDNPEIAGQMAVYREPKPEQENYEDIKYGKRGGWGIKSFKRALKSWLESHHAYRIEPEFKVGDIVYLKNPKHNWYKKLKLKRIDSRKGYFIFHALDGTKGFGTTSPKESSHFHTGQKIDPKDFMYVKKKVNLIAGDNLTKWQEEKEPAEMIKIFTFGVLDNLPNPEHTKFQQSCKSGEIQLMKRE